MRITHNLINKQSTGHVNAGGGVSKKRLAVVGFSFSVAKILWFAKVIVYLQPVKVKL